MKESFGYSTENGNQAAESPLSVEQFPSFEEHLSAIGGSLDKPFSSEENPAKKRKTWQEKAVEKGYSQDEEGNWWKKYDDGFDERVDSFKLDIEFPDLADRTEELAEKYNVRYYDSHYGGLKCAIYGHAESLNKASDEHLENLFKTMSMVNVTTVGTENIIVSYNEDKLSRIVDALDIYYANLAKDFPDGNFPNGIGFVAETLARNYSDNLIEGDFLEQLSKYSTLAYVSARNLTLVQGVHNGILGISQNEDSGTLFGPFMDYIAKVSSEDDKSRITAYDSRASVLSRYVRNHGLNETTIKGFNDIILPLIREKHPEISPVITSGNVYGIGFGNFGIADYAEECFLSTHNPKDLNRLVRIFYEIPTSDYHKFEQNRKDAARLQGTIFRNRDFIHDEQPGVHEVLVAMEDFYNHRDNREEAFACLLKLRALEEKYQFGVWPNAKDLEAYDKPVTFMSESNRAEEGDPKETAIEILRRLVKNTTPDSLHPPKTQYETLNDLMSKIDPLVSPETGDVKVSLEEISPAIYEINRLLLKRIGQQGVFPSTISAVAYLDKMATYALRTYDSKKLPELPFDSTFKEIVRFSQLTSSTGYSDTDFEAKYSEIMRTASEAYGENAVDREKIREAFKSLSQWAVQNANDLSREYAKKKATRRFSEAIWSGNLSDTLISLFERV